jgi:serine/threonine-protein kinase
MNREANTLGKYEIVNEVGRGGFATASRARDPDLDREVALKVLDPILTRDAVWVSRFRGEAQATARQVSSPAKTPDEKETDIG